MIDMWEDYAFKTYLLLFAVSTYNFLLFAGWGIYAWAKEKRKMSSVFWSITALFLSLSCVFAFNVYVRQLRFENNVSEYLAIMGTNAWALRHIPCAVVLGGIGAFMTRRIFLSYFYRKKINRALSGRRKTDFTDL